MPQNKTCLDLVEGGHVHGLHILLNASDVLLQEVRADLVVLNNAAVTRQSDYVGIISS